MSSSSYQEADEEWPEEEEEWTKSKMKHPES